MMAETTAEVQKPEPLGVYTETLARLYWRQGYLDEALRIYRHLAVEQPSETHLQTQIRALIEQIETPLDGPANGAVDDAVEPAAASQSCERAAVVEAAQTQQVVAQLELWLSCLQRQS